MKCRKSVALKRIQQANIFVSDDRRSFHTNPNWLLNSVTCYDRFQFISVRGLCIYSSNRATTCSVFLYNEPNASQSVICHSEFFVERLRYEKPQVFTDLVLSNITRLIDLPGEEFAQLTGDSEPRLPSSSSNGFLRSFNFLKRKGSPSSVTRDGASVCF